MFDDQLPCLSFTSVFLLLVEGNKVPSAPVSLSSVIGSLGLKDVNLREDGSELAAKLIQQLTGDTEAPSSTYFIYNLITFLPFPFHFFFSQCLISQLHPENFYFHKS